MDGYFVTLCIICMIVILFYYILNIVQKELDPLKLFLLIQKQDYDARAFTLRYDKTKQKYENYFFADDLSFKQSYDSYPVDKTGKLITTVYDKHGDVKYTESNGYKISGILTSFACPEGYEGPTCQLKPLCRDPEDNDKLLLLTDIQFNALQLFQDNSKFINSMSRRRGRRRRRKRKTPLYHNRLFIQCKTKGDYEIKSCPINKLLDFNTMKCNLYDICEDHLDGYKHNYSIKDSDKPLAANEYYLCSNNKSVKTKCSDGSVFSIINGGCIQENICYNKGDATISIDDKNYIQCNNDTGIKKYCSHGVMTLPNGSLSCKTEPCKPQIFSTGTQETSYDYGGIICDDEDNEKMILCDQKLIKRTWNYKWSVDISINIDWPRAVYSNHNCIKPTDKIITNPIVKTKWTQLMHDDWDWDILKECFVCPNDSYTWDYNKDILFKGNEIIGRDSYKYFQYDSSQPCQSNTFIPPYSLFKHRTWYKPIRFATIRIYMQAEQFHMWPVKIKNEYHVDTCSYDTKSRLMKITRSVSDKPPFGFQKTDKDGKLKLIDDEEPPIDKEEPPTNDVDDFLWFTIASGKMETFKFPELKSETHIDIECPLSIDKNVNTKFSLIWDNYSAEDFEMSKQLIVNSSGLYHKLDEDRRKLLIDPTYVILQVLNGKLIIDRSIEPIDLDHNLTLK